MVSHVAWQSQAHKLSLRFVVGVGAGGSSSCHLPEACGDCAAEVPRSRHFPGFSGAAYPSAESKLAALRSLFPAMTEQVPLPTKPLCHVPSSRSFNCLHRSFLLDPFDPEQSHRLVMVVDCKVHRCKEQGSPASCFFVEPSICQVFLLRLCRCIFWRPSQELQRAFRGMRPRSGPHHPKLECTLPGVSLRFAARTAQLNPCKISLLKFSQCFFHEPLLPST